MVYKLTQSTASKFIRQYSAVVLFEVLLNWYIVFSFNII